MPATSTNREIPSATPSGVVKPCIGNTMAVRYPVLRKSSAWSIIFPKSGPMAGITRVVSAALVANMSSSWPYSRVEV